MASSGLYLPQVTAGDERRSPLSAAEWLCLAAASAFAVMALETCIQGDNSTVMLCSAGGGMSALDGMVPIYVRMSALHVAPWLRFVPPLAERHPCAQLSNRTGSRWRSKAAPTALNRTNA
jgi:hypothetical protein